MIGHVIGNYKITEKLGEGGMGTVFRGIDVMLDREVAIKMLRPELARDPQVVSRFRSEAVTLAKLNHPNIATLYSFLRQGDDFFMVMEYVNGEVLDKVIQRRGAMSYNDSIKLFCEALQGIKRAHKLGIVHRDIKPANMMLTEDGSIKVMDFGIARVLGSARMTRQGNIVGTIEYMSPEQVRGESADARSDIYSLGILLYEMLTGRVPFVSDSEFSLMAAQINDPPPPPRTFAPDLPVSVEQAILRALAKQPAERFQEVEEFRLALEQGVEPTALRPDVIGFSAPQIPGSAVQQAPAGVAAAAGTVKETRLASSGAISSNFGSVFPKETRLDQATSSSLQQGTVPDATPAFELPQPTGSLVGKLSWMHFAAAGAAAVVLAIVGLSFAFIGGDKGTAKQPAPTAPSPAPASAPVQEDAKPQPSSATVTQTAPVSTTPAGVDGNPIANTAPPNGTRSGVKSPPATRKDRDTAAARDRERRRAEAKRLLEVP